MSTPGSLNYPSSLDDSVSLLNAVNNAATTLADGVAPSDTIITVSSTASFTATGLNSGAMTINGEVIYYTGTTGTTFTGCLRGQDGITAASYAPGTNVAMLMTAGHLNILSEAIIALETKVGTGGATAPTGTGLRHLTDSVEDSTAYTLVAADIPDLDASKITSGVFDSAQLASGMPATGDVPTVQSDGSVAWEPAGEGDGTVTSVAVTVPSDQSVSGSPITTSGTIAITDNTQSANTVKAGPTSGSAAAPTYRNLVAADLATGMPATGDVPTVQSDGSVEWEAGGTGNATEIQGVAVSATTPTSGQVLEYDGTEWAPAAGGTNATSIQYNAVESGALVQDDVYVFQSGASQLQPQLITAVLDRITTAGGEVVVAGGNVVYS